MTIQNKTVTILGASAKVASYSVFPQADGTFRVTISGTADDGAGFTEQLSAVGVYGSGVAALVNMTAAALQKLRQDNGLET